MKPATYLLAAVLAVSPLLATAPEEPLWPWALAAVVLASAALALRVPPRPAAGRATVCLDLALIGWAFLSLLSHALLPHPTVALLGLMLNGGTMLAAGGICFLVGKRLAERDTATVRVLAVAAVGGGGVTAVLALQQFAMNVHAGRPAVAVGGAFAPGYLAGYLLITAPLTVGILAAASRRPLPRLLLGLVALLQVVAVIASGSLLAIIALPASAIVLAAGFARVRRGSGEVRLHSRARTAAAVLGIVLAMLIGIVAGGRLAVALVTVGPFRPAIWYSVVHMVRDNALLGVGVGTYRVLDPLYAPAAVLQPTNAYALIAAECGVPALLLLVALIAAAIGTAWRRLSLAARSDVAGASLPSDSHLLRVGIVAGLVGAAVHFAGDTDLQVFAIAATFWTLAGAATGMDAAEPAPAETPRPARPVLRLAAMGDIAALGLFCIANAVAGAFGGAAQAALSGRGADPVAAERAYRTAARFAPLDGRYPAELGYVDQLLRQRDPASAAASLRDAIHLEPSIENYEYMAQADLALGDRTAAIADMEAGVAVFPTALPILEHLLPTLMPDQALPYLHDVTDIEQALRAVNAAITDPVFAIADWGVADDAARRHDTATAETYYRRCAAALESYADAGGSTDRAHLAQNGGKPDPDTDKRCASLYDQTQKALQALSPPDQDSLATRAVLYESLFDVDLGMAKTMQGDIDGARAAYNHAMPPLLALPMSATEVQVSQAASLSHVAQLKLEELDRIKPPALLHSAP
jgi:tetratricopeptide (TPR) repeat protein